MSWSGVQRKSLRVLRSGCSGVRAGASSLVHVVSWLVRPIKERRSVRLLHGCWEIGDCINDVIADGVPFRG